MFIEKVAGEFNLKTANVKNLIELHQDGNTVPFIARYRKEMTGGMEAEEIRAVIERYEYIINLEKRKEDVSQAILEQEKLTPELEKAIKIAETLKDVEDLYAPYKSKRKTKGDVAREAGLLPLAEFIWGSESLELLEFEAGKFLNEVVLDTKMAVDMATDILIENIGRDPEIRTRIKELYATTTVFSCEKRKEITDRTSFEDYYEYEEKISTIPPHRLLAIFRGEREKVLKVKLTPDEKLCSAAVVSISTQKGMKLNDIALKSASTAFKKSISVSAELDLRSTLRDEAEQKAIEVFAKNLKSLLLTPKVKGKTIMGIDPAYRTGCKFAVVDETGKLLDWGVMFPTKPQEDIEGSRKLFLKSVEKCKVTAVAIGNGTASRETEEFVSELIKEKDLKISYTIVSEAGASVYSAGDVAAKEFPELDVTIRGAISIARRVVDPLSELVKIEPRSIGVGMYQHDINPKKLGESLENVVEDVVNSVGVDLNTASPSLLRYVAGLTKSTAEKVVALRDKIGRFVSRKQLMDVDGIGQQTFLQCAGFLKVYDGQEPMDTMFIHPESYEAAYSLLEKLDISLKNTELIRLALKNKNLKFIAKETGLGEFTMNDILENLEKPDRDIRDSLDPVIFKKGIVNLEDIKEGMLLQGKITNVVDFGAFVDLGLKNDGLVHISHLADKFVKHPSDVVSIGDNVNVRVLSVDKDRGRVSLTMKN